MPTAIQPLLNTTYDIETGCPVKEDGRTPDDELLLRAYGPFDPKTVKVPQKDSKTEADRLAYLARKEAEYLPELRQKAALNPMLATITAVIYNRTGRPEIVTSVGDGKVTEAHLLEDFWARWERLKPGESMVGWNNFGFDDEMIIQRSVVNGVRIPRDALKVNPSGSRSLRKSRDLAPELYGDPKVMRPLDEVSRSFGGPGKNGDGAFFSQLARSGDPEQVRMAFDYIKNDDVMTRTVSGAMGITAAPVENPGPGTDYIVAPRSRRPDVAPILFNTPALPLEEGPPLYPPVLFSLVATPKGDDHLGEIYGRFDPQAVEIPKKYSGSEAEKQAYLRKEEAEHIAKLRKAAASDGLNSVIRAAGYLTNGKMEVVTGNEKDILTDFWSRYTVANETGGMAGWGNLAKEDDFLVMRSLASGAPIPADAVKVSPGGYRSISNVKDLAVLLSGDPKTAPQLSHVATALVTQAPASKDTDLADLWRTAPDAHTTKVRTAYHLNDRLEVLSHVARSLIQPSPEVARQIEPALTLVEPRFHARTPAPRIVADMDDDIPWDFPPRTDAVKGSEALLSGKATLPPPSVPAVEKPRPAVSHPGMS